jgi:predicted small metal-binding protein
VHGPALAAFLAPDGLPTNDGEMIMKSFECGTLVPGCTWHTQAEDTAEIVRRAAEHLRNAHGEELIRPNMVDEIKARVHEKGEAVH